MYSNRSSGAGHVATGSKSDGLGLGLAIVKSIVELHRGIIDVKSDGAGKGCECVVRLPLQRI